MSESSKRPAIQSQQSYAAVFNDPDLAPARRVDEIALHNIRRVNLMAAGICAGASHTSLDLWYVDLDVSADSLNCFRQCLSNDELARSARFHSELHRARYIVGRATLRRVLAYQVGCSP